MAVTHKLAIGYFDTLINAKVNNLGNFDEIFTSGYDVKNDGGGAHYKRYDPNAAVPPMGFLSLVGTTTHWGLIPNGGVINPLQAGAKADGTNDRLALQTCIDFITFWNTTNHQATYTTVGLDTVTEADSSRTAVKLVIPGNHAFVVDRRSDHGAGAGLDLTGPITIEGEDRLTSRILFLENTNETAKTAASENGGDAGIGLPGSGQHGQASSLFYTSLDDTVDTRRTLISGIAFRNFTVTGSYGPSATGTGHVPGEYPQNNGDASMLTIYRMDNVLLENMVFERNRAVIVNGGATRNFTMRGCLMAESRRGGLVITDADNVVVEDNTFRWVADDPVAITLGADSIVAPPFLAAGGVTRITGNRSFGCRGLNVNGAKNVLIEGNACVLCRGRAIHVGCGTDQDKGDTTTLNIIVRHNIITDQLDSDVDPEQAQLGASHRAIDIEMLQTAPNPIGTPGIPNASGVIVDPTQYHYKELQGLQGRRIWKAGDKYLDVPVNPDERSETWWLGRLYHATNATVKTAAPPPPTHTGADTADGGGVVWHYLSPQPTNPTPYSGNILIEGNIISRTRPPAVPAPPPGSPLQSDHIDEFDNFASYNVGPWGGFPHIYAPGENVTVTLDEITPDEGIAVGGSVRNLIIRGNQIRNCATAILFYGKNIPVPFSLLDVTVVDNDLSDWKTAGIRFKDYEYTQAGQPTASFPQRVSILDNRADGDPFCWNQIGTVRNTGGMWYNVTAGAFVDVTNLGFVLIAGNHVRNVPQLVAGLDDALHAMRDNVGYCNPDGVGFVSTNVGIGTLLAPQLGWRYVIEGGNPASANWGKVLNACPLAIAPPTPGGGLAAVVPPAGGKWVAGAFVANLSAAKIGTGTTAFEVSGWRRMTTGTGNTLGTDWQQQCALTG